MVTSRLRTLRRGTKRRHLNPTRPSPLRWNMNSPSPPWAISRATSARQTTATYLFGRALHIARCTSGHRFLQRRNRDGRWDPLQRLYRGTSGFISGSFRTTSRIGRSHGGARPLIDGSTNSSPTNTTIPPTSPTSRRLSVRLHQPTLENPAHRGGDRRPRLHRQPGGLADGGNDDLGTMSAWYVLSQLGFYPVDPGVPDYEVCTPRFPRSPCISIRPCRNDIHHPGPGRHAGKRVHPVGRVQRQTADHAMVSAGRNHRGGMWSLKLGRSRTGSGPPRPRPALFTLDGIQSFPAGPDSASARPTSEKEPQSGVTPRQNRPTTGSSPIPGCGMATGPAPFRDKWRKDAVGGTSWKSGDIWMRRNFTLPRTKASPPSPCATARTRRSTSTESWP